MDTGGVRPFERVCFNLSRHCGAVPLASFLANDYQDLDIRDYHILPFGQTPTDNEPTDANLATLQAATVGPEFRGVQDGEEGQPARAGAPSGATLPLGGPASATTDSLVPKPSTCGTTGSHPTSSSSTTDSKLLHSKPTPENAQDMLEQTCLRLCGTTEGLLIWEVFRDHKLNTFGAILTVTSLTGLQRTYRTPSPQYPTGLQAKREAAYLAIQMGALDFLRTGEEDRMKHKKEELVARAKIAEQQSRQQREEKGEDEDDAVRLVEEACERKHAKIYWVPYRNPTNREQWGMALRVALSLHQAETYSTEATFESKAKAKAQCASTALKEDLLEYLKSGEGNGEPSARFPSGLGIQLQRAASHRYSLQEYFDTLPKPFPIEVGQKSALDLKPVNWVNSLVQGTKVPGLKVNYYFTSSDQGAASLSGCVLRVEWHPNAANPQKIDWKLPTYIVDCHFARRADAKAAVCLLAVSQDMQGTIQQLKERWQDSREALLSRAHRTLAESRIIPTLMSKGSKLTQRAGTKGYHRIRYEWGGADGAFGCTLKVDVSNDPNFPDVREFSVAPQYLSKLEAKCAAACVAAKSGVIELLHSRSGGVVSEVRGRDGQKRGYWDILNDLDMDEEDRGRELSLLFTEGGRGVKRKHDGGKDSHSKKIDVGKMGVDDGEIEQGQIVEDDPQGTASNYSVSTNPPTAPGRRAKKRQAHQNSEPTRLGGPSSLPRPPPSARPLPARPPPVHPTHFPPHGYRPINTRYVKTAKCGGRRLWTRTSQVPPRIAIP
ncbi:hypothetical protein CC1G_06976 [Coprinopsis cinerea okayama7|uniref:Uncharacterized protein n=1 Tax=Coprinopsis cinerea (strain Okayama-7 / 130 / ATCC MYA-4618 / FGSC 9003) TaxID=240176 RepID=A8NZX0_COPC7|nr:hypothetical protein CC1G_06976 [Coprinopsis cinerea okayama7\|eukprot:XP_001837770.2 hypothetical protein CC1G_06976 [Coprinopsis cinerea okayama7\